MMSFFEKKHFWVYFGHFWYRRPIEPKIFAKNCPFKLYILTIYFLIEESEKMVQGRSVDPPDFDFGVIY
jgi:hypothetical protein